MIMFGFFFHYRGSSIKPFLVLMRLKINVNVLKYALL